MCNFPVEPMAIPWGPPLPWRIGTTTAGPGARLPKDVTQGKAFDYYPRGRVELRQGRAYLFLSPLLCREEVVLQVKDAFGLDQLPVLLKADGSRHYRCYLDE